MNPTFLLNLEAVLIVLIIGLVFLRFYKKRNKSKEPKLWLAGDYYTFLRANIQTCMTFEKLEELKNVVDAFYSKEFRVPISRSDRTRYYTRLMETISKRENEMEGSLLAGITSN